MCCTATKNACHKILVRTWASMVIPEKNNVSIIQVLRNTCIVSAHQVMKHKRNTCLTGAASSHCEALCAKGRPWAHEHVTTRIVVIAVRSQQTMAACTSSITGAHGMQRNRQGRAPTSVQAAAATHRPSNLQCNRHGCCLMQDRANPGQ